MTEICRCSQRSKQNCIAISRLHAFLDGLRGLNHEGSGPFLHFDGELYNFLLIAHKVGELSLIQNLKGILWRAFQKLAVSRSEPASMSGTVPRLFS